MSLFSANVNMDVNKTFDQVSNAVDKASDKKVVSDKNIIKMFFKDSSYTFNLYYNKLIDAGTDWTPSDDCTDELMFWQFVEIKGKRYTPIQDRENPKTGKMEYRINPSFYNMFKSYFDKYIRPDM